MDQIEEIKSKIDIVDLISEYFPLKRAGRNFKALCPFHSEKTPSFMVSPELQIFKCFGCGSAGDVIKFLQLYERMDFWEAVELLAKRTGIKLKKFKLDKEESLKRRIYAMNDLASRFYHFLLTKHQLGQKALAYAHFRGLKEETLRQFKIGFSPLKPEILATFLLKKGFSGQELLQSGIFFKSQYSSGNQLKLLDRFYGRLIFPLFDHRGNIVSFAGRLIPGLLPDEDKRGKYINGPDTVVYHKSENLYGLWLTKEEIKKTNEAILVEGELDLISSWQAGIKNIVAAKGTALTVDQIKLIKRFASNLKLAFDADFAGDQAALRGIILAEKEGLEMSVVLLPKGIKDPDELAYKDPESLKKAIDRAIPVWDFVIQSGVKQFGLSSPLAKKKVLQKVLPLLSQIENEVVKLEYYKKLAQILSTSFEAIMIESTKLKTAPIKTQSILSEKETATNREAILEEYLLALILLEGKPKRLSTKIKFETFVLKRIWERLKQFLREKKKFEPTEFFAFLPEELRPKLETIFLLWGDKKIKDFNQEIRKITREIKRTRLRKRLSLLSLEIAQEEKKGSPRLNRLRKKFAILSQKLFALES